jgi:hypothetical protein
MSEREMKTTKNKLGCDKQTFQLGNAIKKRGKHDNKHSKTHNSAREFGSQDQRKTLTEFESNK